MRPLCPLSLLLAAAGACAQEVSVDRLLQVGAARQRFGDDLRQQGATSRQLEARFDLKAAGQRSEFVARPRLRWSETDTGIPAYPQPRRASFTEVYGSVDPAEPLRLTAGKRYLAWGPALLYSPSNRLFPDNGSAGPRQEIDGRWMVSGGWVAPGGLQMTALAADPYLSRTPAIDRRGAFLLLRAEHVATADGEWGWGWTAGGGGGLRPYAGGHAQRSLGDAMTIALEASASRGYATPAPGFRTLHQDQHRTTGDAALSLRHGLADGGELAAEFVHNGYHLAPAELQFPHQALLPLSATTQRRHAARHPLPERRYLNLQASLPKLFGRSRWTLFVRHLEALDSHGRMDFAELGYSPTDRATLYLGVTATHGSAASSLLRSVRRAAYVAAELNL